MYPIWLLETIIVGILWSILVILAIHKVFLRIWIPACLLNFVFIFFYKSGMEMKDHGGINRFGFVCTIVVLFTLYAVSMAFRKVWKYSKFLFGLVILWIVFLIWLFYTFQIKGSCGDWAAGLGGHRLVNSDSQCKVPIPTLCELGTRSNWFDFAKFDSKCESKSMLLNNEMLPQDLRYKPGSTRIGFPRVEKLPTTLRVNQTMYKDYVRDQLIDMNDKEVSQEVKDSVEFVVDISDPNNHKLELTLKPNSTRAAEQKELREQVVSKEKQEGTYQNRVDKNVLILYIDNLSRAHFNRKMPKTAEWLSQYVDNQESEYSTYQYFRYHSVYYNTLFSNNAMYFGAVKHVEDTSENVFDSFSKNGYMTGFFKDSCETISNSIHDQNLRMHSWDHFGGTVACDTNYDDTDFTSLHVFSGKGSAIRHCLYGQDMHNIQMDYLKQFWAAYPENRKFFRTHFSEAHELTGELVKYMDEDLRDLLEYFKIMGYLEDTFITIVSDHGAHALTLRFPAFPDNSRYIENYYPVLFHVTKKDIPAASAHFLEANEQSFISSLDFYASLKTLAENKRSTSKFADSYPYAFEMVPSSHD